MVPPSRWAPVPCELQAAAETCNACLQKSHWHRRSATVLQDLCAVAPPPTQPLAKLENECPSGKPPLGAARRSTAQDLLQEKYSVKVRHAGVSV